MILPDDKNPSIVWDPEKKKWVNTDGDADEQEAFKPPPKMSDLMPSQPQTQSLPQQQQQQSQPQQQLQPQQSQPQTQQINQIPFMDVNQQQQTQQFVPHVTPAASPNPLQQQQQQQQSSQNQGQQPPGPAKTPTLQSNMFKMQRNRSELNCI